MSRQLSNRMSSEEWHRVQDERHRLRHTAQDKLLGDPGGLDRLTDSLRQRALDEFYLLNAYVRREIVRSHGERICAAADRYLEQSNLITSDSAILEYFEDQRP